MKTRIIIFITVLTSLVSYSQKNETPVFNEGVIAITTDVNNFAVKKGRAHLNLDINYIGKLNIKNFPDMIVWQIKFGYMYSDFREVNKSFSKIFVTTQAGIGAGYSKSNFGFYSTISVGTDAATKIFTLFEDEEKEKEKARVNVYSHLNVGATYFFGEKSIFGIIAEYSYALKGINMISTGLAININ